MKIAHIICLADIYDSIRAGAQWFVATQIHPEFWSNPDKPLQWYIDAKWLIKTDRGFVYDPNHINERYDAEITKLSTPDFFNDP